jgi:N-methylhydantoinase B
MPVFFEGALVAFMAAVAHIADIGGRLDYFDARDLYEEGFQIPPSKLFRAGGRNRQLFRLLAANVRVPDMVIGDVEAMVGAEKLGRERMLDFLADYGGADGFQALADEILARSDRAIRDALRKLPDGVWRYGIDADGYRTPLRIEVEVRKTGDSIHVDYSGSSAQFSDGSINCATNITFADTYYPIKCSLAAGVPNNEGLFRAITMSAPEGSVFNARRPAAVRSRSKSSFHIHVAIYGALADLMPDRIQAGSGSFWALTLHGVHPDDGGVFNVHVLPNGGKGATALTDGLPTIAFPYNGTVTPAEIVENQAPVLVEYKRLVADSGGAGARRGGLGQEIAFRVIAGESLIASLRPDKVRHPAPGVLGGLAGMPGAFALNGEAFAVEPRTLRPGDVLSIRLPGGGGHGDPRARDRARLAEDVADGFVSPAAARDLYGLTDDPL